MLLSRLKLGSAILLILLIVFGLGTSCGDEKVKAQFRKVVVACSGNPMNIPVSLDPTSTAPVNPPDIYLCPDDTVTWQPVQSGLQFTVFFKNHTCPFKDCKNINQSNATSKAMKKVTNLTVYDYGVLMNDDEFDPHVVGGGG